MGLEEFLAPSLTKHKDPWLDPTPQYRDWIAEDIGRVPTSTFDSDNWGIYRVSSASFNPHFRMGLAFVGKPSQAIAATIAKILAARWTHKNLNPDCAEELPFELTQAIDESRFIYALKEDWDDEGSPGYTQAFWEQAISFLRSNAERLRAKCGYWVPSPNITPGPYGSIDIHWKTQNRELLINIPSNPGEPASYYGDDRGKNKIKGTLNISDNNEWILLWLMS
jgi:hypothetical protein